MKNQFSRRVARKAPNGPDSGLSRSGLRAQKFLLGTLVNKHDNGAIHRALLKFAHLNERGQGKFISQMNDFLLASPKRRRLLTEIWEREQDVSAMSLMASDRPD
ncbi:hypothetical protein ACFWP0_23125 [Achromobacter sp. NPDC058515]|uniref:hypothetical protein n=1 Tax=Achromobacter sp. NPDC058515 TaxID=3346533 RepID=UPI0036507D9A